MFVTKRVIFPATMLALLAAASVPTTVVGQESAVPQQIELLQHRISNLERRVRELEARLNGTSVVDTVKPMPQSWRQLRRDMSMDEVRALLGEPESVSAYPTWTTWEYPGDGTVMFNEKHKVTGWREPRERRD